MFTSQGEKDKQPNVRRVWTKQQLHQVETLAKLGATDKQFAMFFQVAVVTVELWTRQDDNFREARKRGGIEADMKVAQSLFKRATGYSYIEEEYTQVTDQATGRKLPLSEMALVKKIKKQVVPDTKAAIQWLKVRQREAWMVTPEFIHTHTGKVEHLHKKLQEIPIEDLTPAAQELLLEIAQKQLMVSNREN